MVNPAIVARMMYPHYHISCSAQLATCQKEMLTTTSLSPGMCSSTAVHSDKTKFLTNPLMTITSGDWDHLFTSSIILSHRFLLSMLVFLLCFLLDKTMRLKVSKEMKMTISDSLLASPVTWCISKN
jgi:hypothetical protein